MKNYIQPNPNEQFLWEGGPDRKATVLESIFNPLLPFAAVWLLVDLFLIGTAAGDGEGSGFLVGFFAFHLMPVYFYVGGILFSGLRAKNTYYILTDRAVYFQSGIFTVSTEREPLNEVTHTGIHRGILDQMLGLGDILIVCMHDQHVISNIREFEKVSSMISTVSTDTYTDTMYPNDLRPGENHGYRTTYQRKDW